MSKNELVFLKHAEKKSKERSNLKDVLSIAGGTAVGAGLGYGTGLLIRKKYGKKIDHIDPKKRLKYLVPTAAALGGGAALVNVLRDRAELREKKNARSRK
tara:strand:+ start:6687 stop:6986 length:300 start_codon:yes stop_codon:yes gene_type:complete